ncbi:MAG: glycosyltransferase family 2 protein [Candidatus Omnitrophota bacterium]|jgi:glycosyltransferase involved in cell wall biosynthesis
MWTIVSIITPSFKQGESVISQFGQFYLDYVIMDGGSTDATVGIIKKYEKLFSENCVKVNLEGLDFYINKSGRKSMCNCFGISYRWFSEKDNGQADALNKGFKIARGDVLGFLNSDDVYYQSCLKQVIERIGKSDIVYGKAMWISKKGKDLLPYPTLKPTKYSFYYQCTLCQPAVFFRKSFYQNNGKFSTDYIVFDFEFWMRALFNNIKFKKINKFLSKSRMYNENKSLNFEQRVGNETKLLRDKFYKSLKLNKFILWLAKYYVDRYTHTKVRKLKKLITDDTSMDII